MRFARCARVPSANTSAMPPNTAAAVTVASWIEEIDVDAELVDAYHDAADHDHGLREPCEQTALTDAEPTEACSRMWRASVPPIKLITMMSTPPIAEGRKPSRFGGPAFEQRAAEDPERSGREDQQHDPVHDGGNRAARRAAEGLRAFGGARQQPAEEPVHAMQRAPHEVADHAREQPADETSTAARGQRDGQVSEEPCERVAEHADQLRSPDLQLFHASSGPAR